MVNKEFKYVILRIIIGVGIAFVLGLLTNFVQVNAAEVLTATPTKLCGINGTSDSCNLANVNSYQVYDRTFYGNAFGADATRGRIVWTFPSNDNFKNKSFDMTFIIFLQGSSNYVDSTRGYIQISNHIYSCSIDNTRYGTFNFSSGGGGSGAYSQTVAEGSAAITCTNVVFENTTNFNFYLMDYTTRTSGVIAISPITMVENDTAAIKQEIAETNQIIHDSNISSDTSDTIDDILEFGDNETTYGPVADLILLPLTLFGAFYSSFGGSCSSYNLGTLMNHQIILPCIDLEDVLGSSLYAIIDIAISLFMIYNIVLMCIRSFDRITSLYDPFQELFKPGGGVSG